MNCRLEIRQQLIGSREPVGSSLIIPRTVPMIVLRAGLLKARAVRRHRVGIVEADQPVATRIVQRERIAQSVRPFG